jgi:hypothetical protein
MGQAIKTTQDLVQAATNFRRIFGCSLTHYYSRNLGFDVLTFEREFHLENDYVSLGDMIKMRYGTDGLTTIEHLLATN